APKPGVQEEDQAQAEGQVGRPQLLGGHVGQGGPQVEDRHADGDRPDDPAQGALEFAGRALVFLDQFFDLLLVQAVAWGVRAVGPVGGAGAAAQAAGVGVGTNVVVMAGTGHGSFTSLPKMVSRTAPHSQRQSQLAKGSRRQLTSTTGPRAGSGTHRSPTTRVRRPTAVARTRKGASSVTTSPGSSRKCPGMDSSRPLGNA